MRPWTIAVIALFSSCASAPPARTFQLRAFLGAAQDGSWAFAEVNEFPGSAAHGQIHQIGPGLGLLRSTALPEANLSDAVRRAAEAGDRAQRTADLALAQISPEGYDPERAELMSLRPGGDGKRLPLPIPAEIELRREGGELRLAVRLVGGDQEIVAYRLPVAGETWIDGLRLLPGGRRALVLTGSAASTRSGFYRLEGLGEVDLAGAVAALLDARAVRHIREGALEPATEDLLRALSLEPNDAVAHYNLACAHALSNELDEAILSLGRAIDLDPERLRSAALGDPDLAALRPRVEFRLMVEPRSPGAVPQ